MARSSRHSSHHAGHTQPPPKIGVANRSNAGESGVARHHSFPAQPVPAAPLPGAVWFYVTCESSRIGPRQAGGEGYGARRGRGKPRWNEPGPEVAVGRSGNDPDQPSPVEDLIADYVAGSSGAGAWSRRAFPAGEDVSQLRYEASQPTLSLDKSNETALERGVTWEAKSVKRLIGAAIGALLSLSAEAQSPLNGGSSSASALDLRASAAIVGGRLVVRGQTNLPDGYAIVVAAMIVNPPGPIEQTDGTQTVFSPPAEIRRGVFQTAPMSCHSSLYGPTKPLA